ncbi:hypothetical protein ACH9EU_13965 [Kocuria sp. M1R5S2]|uniref:hypothetical protein n=1 Tax=Kocuria rhizosphaerae TaxID=3376285 RepID=UPI0037B21695
MNKGILATITATAFAASLAVAAPASAAVTFDAATGNGFVGKGDVQLAAGWNNKQLQDNAAAVNFKAQTVSATEATWTCDRDAGPQTQARASTTTTTTSGVVSAIARERNQITGFVLSGYDGGDPVVEEERDGPAVGSCATGWTAINLVVGETEVLDSGLFLFVGGNLIGELAITPVV